MKCAEHTATASSALPLRLRHLASDANVVSTSYRKHKEYVAKGKMEPAPSSRLASRYLKKLEQEERGKTYKKTDARKQLYTFDNIIHRLTGRLSRKIVHKSYTKITSSLENPGFFV